MTITGISRIYRLYRNCFVIGVSIDISQHIHTENDDVSTVLLDEYILTIEFLIWGVDIQLKT
mgnify:CR=1 FL=1